MRNDTVYLDLQFRFIVDGKKFDSIEDAVKYMAETMRELSGKLSIELELHNESTSQTNGR